MERLNKAQPVADEVEEREKGRGGGGKSSAQRSEASIIHLHSRREEGGSRYLFFYRKTGNSRIIPLGAAEGERGERRRKEPVGQVLFHDEGLRHLPPKGKRKKRRKGKTEKRYSDSRPSRREGNGQPSRLMTSLIRKKGGGEKEGEGRNLRKHP